MPNDALVIQNFLPFFYFFIYEFSEVDQQHLSGFISATLIWFQLQYSDEQISLTLDKRIWLFLSPILDFTVNSCCGVHKQQTEVTNLLIDLHNSLCHESTVCIKRAMDYAL